MQSVFVTTLLKSHPPPPLHAASMRVPHCNFFLSPIYWMSQAAHIYSLSKRPDNTLQLPTRRAISWCWLLSLFPLSMAVPFLRIPTFIYALYSLIRSKSVWLTSCNRIILISCLWRKSVSAFSSSMSHHRLYGRYFIGVCRYIRKKTRQRSFTYTCVNVARIPLLLLFRVRDTLFSPLDCVGSFRLVGCDAFKEFVSGTNSALSAIDTPNCTSLAPLPCTWCLSVWFHVSPAVVLFIIEVK